MQPALEKNAPAEKNAAQDLAPLHLVVVGHVDHGKSTLLGRLLHDLNALPPGRLEELQKASLSRGGIIEWSFVLDALQAERDQAVTIDTTRLRLKLPAQKGQPTRELVIIDAPGHREFLQNMISGAAAADAALLLIDAKDGIQEQTRRHAALLQWLGLQQCAVLINKMDAVDFSASRFAELEREVTIWLQSLSLSPTAIIPIAARDGLNLLSPAPQMPWYKGPTLVEHLHSFSIRAHAGAPLRLPVQDVYFQDGQRILVGQIASGSLKLGDQLFFAPHGRSANIRSLETFGSDKRTDAEAGMAVAITLDAPIFVERGNLAHHAEAPPKLCTLLPLRIFWLAHAPLKIGDRLGIKLATKATNGQVHAVRHVLDVATMQESLSPNIERHNVADIILRLDTPLAIDDAKTCAATSRALLLQGFETVGGGQVLADEIVSLPVGQEAGNLHAVTHLLTPERRSARNGHKPAILWFTGLSGAGKSTLAMRLEQLLFSRGLQTYVLDGDNVRRGLNSDLGFSPGERAENIRRVASVSALFADAGLIVITAFISPYRADRERARAQAAALGDIAFHEIYLRADLGVCEERDPKGLYKKARLGEIKEFTGISAPYEAPEKPDLIIDTGQHDIESCLSQLWAYIEQHCALPIANKE